VTKALIGLNGYVFLEVAAGPVGVHRDALAYGLVPAVVLGDPTQQWYRIVTSMFLHGSVAHVLGNMRFLWVFGPALEARPRSLAFALLYVVAGVSGGLAQALFLPASAEPFVGASAAIAGVLGVSKRTRGPWPRSAG